MSFMTRNCGKARWYAAFTYAHFGRSFLFCALSNDKIRFGKTANARALARGHMGVHALALPQDVLLVDGVRIALSLEYLFRYRRC